MGEMSENSELRDGGDVCILSDRGRASKGGEREAGGGGGAGVGGREEKRRV